MGIWFLKHLSHLSWSIVLCVFPFEEYKLSTNLLALIGSLYVLIFLIRIVWIFVSACYSTWVMFLSCSKNDNLINKYGKWALITGCTDGIGRAYAIELAKRGLNLVLASRTPEKLVKLENSIKQQYSVETRIIPVDFTTGAAAIETVRQHLEAIPHIGILVNNVGKIYEYPMPLEELAEEDIREMININIGTTTMMTRLVIEKMKDRRQGAIVNISSFSGNQPCPLINIYASTKVYVKYFSAALREEYSKHGITVQTLTPFFVNTTMTHYIDGPLTNSLIMPDPETFAKYAVKTLGKLNDTSGYWAHGIQDFFLTLPPVWLRIKIGGWLMRSLREAHLSRQKNLIE